jgi:cytidylate kinase
MLAGRTDALHVFCYAPRAALAERAAARLGVSIAAAERTVHETNQQRAQFVRRNFHRDWLSPENYHLMVNTSWLGLDGAADLIITLARTHLG